MSKNTKTVWRVKTSDEAYAGENRSWLFRGDLAAAGKKALKAHKANVDDGLVGGDQKSRPYITSIELVGELDN